MRRLFVFAVSVMMLLITAMPAGAVAPLDTVFVPADADPWTATSVEVTEGQELNIRAHGQAITGPLRQFPGARSGPDGQAFTCPDPGGPPVGCASDGDPYGALIGKVGSSTFLIGSGGTFAMPETGNLELAVNDNLGFYSDNHGGFAVQIRD